MDPESKKLLEKTYAVEKDTNRMMHIMRRDQVLGFVLKLIVWAFVLAIPFYLYQQYLQPFVNRFSAGHTATSTSSFSLPTLPSLQSLQSMVPSSAQVQKMLNAYKVTP